MLDKPIEDIKYDESGQVCGVTSQGETAKTKMVISDPTYFPDKVKKVGQVNNYVSYYRKLTLHEINKFLKFVLI